MALHETLKAAALIEQEYMAIELINEELEKKNKNSNVYRVLTEALSLPRLSF